MKQIDGFWFPGGSELKQAREWMANSVDWELAIPHIESWGCAIDAGAHVGLWTIRLAERFEAVHAFEPDPGNFACLQRNVDNLENVFLYNVALGEKQRRAGLTGKQSPSRHLAAGEDTMVFPLDTFGLSPSFMKLDIEGSEAHALQGAVETLKAHPVVMLEDKYFQRYGQPHPLAFLPGYREIAKIHRDRIYIHDSPRG